MRGDDDWLKKLSTTDITHLIDEWCHSERNRNILKRRYLDGIRYEQLAEEFEMSVRQVQNIVCEEMKRLSAM